MRLAMASEWVVEFGVDPLALRLNVAGDEQLEAMNEDDLEQEEST